MPFGLFQQPARFLGYIPQNYSIYRGGVASHQAKFQRKLDRSIHSDIVGVLKAAGVPTATQVRAIKLGEVKDFGTLVASSQDQGVPISEVNAGTPAQRATAKEAFQAIASKIVERAI